MKRPVKKIKDESGAARKRKRDSRRDTGRVGKGEENGGKSGRQKRVRVVARAGAQVDDARRGFAD